MDAPPDAAYAADPERGRAARMRRLDIDRRRLAALVGAGLIAPGAAFGAVIVNERDSASRIPPPPDYVPPADLKTIADIYRRMTAPIRVNGLGPFAFVVDTGANQSVISEELAIQLGLTRGPVEPLNGVAGVQMTATTIARLDVGDRRDADVVLSILPAAAIGGLGMLGLDRLEDQRLTLDFRGQRLRIEASRHAWRDPDDVAMKAHRRDGQLTLVDADLDGVPVVAFLDSGAQNTIGNMVLRELAITRSPTSFWTVVPILSATGQTIDAEIADLPQLRVGGLHLPNWPVAFADLHTFELWDLTRTPAILLGVDVLSRFAYVSLDFARGEVRFRLPQQA
ncbi:MAG TPA: retroviral-like aspartic protease family protein [Caulobacteraceae bacterium]|jgi:predicted aspartyl protease|nr:retroviral-like aspartic protease family protein [Caulobacteraceae bacterium]